MVFELVPSGRTDIRHQ